MGKCHIKQEYATYFVFIKSHLLLFTVKNIEHAIDSVLKDFDENRTGVGKLYF